MSFRNDSEKSSATDGSAADLAYVMYEVEDFSRRAIEQSSIAPRSK